MTLSGLEWLMKIFDDTKHRAASLRQLSYLYFLVFYCYNALQASVPLYAAHYKSLLCFDWFDRLSVGNSLRTAFGTEEVIVFLATNTGGWDRRRTFSWEKKNSMDRLDMDRLDDVLRWTGDDMNVVFLWRRRTSLSLPPARKSVERCSWV